jgi:hypothetical protein
MLPAKSILFFTYTDIYIYLQYLLIYVFPIIGLILHNSRKRIRIMSTYIWPIYVLYNRQFTPSQT